MVYIPYRYLGAFIVILSFVGVYSIRNSLADCTFAVVFTFIGFILRRLNWPLVPGLVSGSIIVERLTAGAGQIKSAVDLINRPVLAAPAYGSVVGSFVGVVPMGIFLTNLFVLDHFDASLTPTVASFAAALKMGFEFADDSALDLDRARDRSVHFPARRRRHLASLRHPWCVRLWRSA